MKEWMVLGQDGQDRRRIGVELVLRNEFGGD